MTPFTRSHMNRRYLLIHEDLEKMQQYMPYNCKGNYIYKDNCNDKDNYNDN